jgi:hypothetical protein
MVQIAAAVARAIAFLLVFFNMVVLLWLGWLFTEASP